MFYYLNGTIAHVEPSMAVVDVGGVGYACYVTANTLSYITVGERAKLYTYCNIREDAFDIYGFYNESEKRSFEMLIGVSGVGPKAALAILSVCSPETLATAVITDNEKAITAAAGVGKKLAQRVILELKDKMAKEYDSSSFSSNTGTLAQTGSKGSEAASALAVLGYTPNEITAALKNVDVERLSLEEIIRQALKFMLK